MVGSSSNFYSHGNSHGNHKWAAVKSPLGAQTVLGDRHDLIYEIFVTSAVGRLRNSPERTFQRLGTHFDLRVRRRDQVLREFASRAGVRVGEAQHV